MAGKKLEKKAPSSVVNAYLVGYNAVQTLGWSYLLYLLASFYIFSPPQSLYDSVRFTLNIFQNAAVLEILHAATGMVSSNPVLTTFQVASRVVVVCGILMPTQAARESFGLPLLLLAWSVTEIVRYSTYVLTILGAVPYFLKYLRYTLFIGLYVLGVTGELLCIYAAQGEVGAKQLFSTTMPNKLNFIFNYQYLLIFLMLLYIPLFPKLYLHMFAQRKKVLGSPKKDR